MSEEWVPFQERIAKGNKRGLPRGVRFVYLELALEARRRSGIIELIVGWTTEKAVHDLIGGNRREIKKALSAFTKPDEDGLCPIEIVRDESRHRLIVTKWPQWAGPKSSTQRVRDFRERQKLAELAWQETLPPVSGRNGETPYSTGQDRTGEEITEQPPLAPQGGEEDSSQAQTPPASPIVHDGGKNTTYDAAWRLWRELYEQSRRSYGRYVEVFVQDDRVVQRLAHRAEELADGKRDRVLAVLRHWFVSYLRDDGDLNCHANARHPLRLIERRLPTYGDLPKPASARRIKAARAAEPPPLSNDEHLAAIERARAIARGIGDPKKGPTA